MKEWQYDLIELGRAYLGVLLITIAIILKLEFWGYRII